MRAAGVACEVVNGITSGLAAATAVGVPFTHRDFCHGAILVTGHERDGTKTDWAALARTGLPLVIYMGVANREAICAGLAAGGLSPSTPAVAIQNASRPDQRSRGHDPCAPGARPVAVPESAAPRSSSSARSRGWRSPRRGPCPRRFVS